MYLSNTANENKNSDNTKSNTKTETNFISRIEQENKKHFQFDSIIRSNSLKIVFDKRRPANKK